MKNNKNYDGKTRGQVITDFDNNQELRDRLSVSQAEALDSFIEASGLAQTVARGIDKAMNDNMGWDPDAINWASVGTINHINELLDQVQFAIESATGSKEWFATEITGSY
jgi:hypothetical protein